METREKLTASIKTGLIDHSLLSREEFRPHLVLNEKPENNVLATLIRELEQCESFQFSVAFITRGGVATLLQPLYDLKKRGVKGRILTSDYLNFSDPDALETLLNYFPNIKIKVYSGHPFHAKGYLFQHQDHSSLVIGSSNLTQQALTTTREWNLRLVSLEDGELLRQTYREFESAWEVAHKLTSGWLSHYREVRKAFPVDQEIKKETLEPNLMQREALASLKALREEGATRALLISATGSGKTYLSALDVEAFRAKRLLFIVHRQQIAKVARESFLKILGADVPTALLAGQGSLRGGESHLFAMIQTLSKDEVLTSFKPDAFDYIIVDEVHRAGATSYEKVLNYFKPQFLLGMTATPERTDGYDIYRLFNHTIAYEIRLNEALEADLLAPFHYYGIAQLEVNKQEYDDLSQFSRLDREEWAKQIKATIDRYSIGTSPRRGLIFCSRNTEAQFLAERLAELGLKTLALSGADSSERRDEAFTRLEEGELEYLVAVDIFNEGIDIPSLNQIIMVRPTQSAIIFVQQLGRGLRKFPGKEFLTVIDFVGNYTNNYLIPIALYGDTSYKKDNLRKLISSGSLTISGESTVNFDPIAKERIFKAINEVSFLTIRILKEEYLKVRTKVGRIPTMIDFVRHGAISPLLFIDKSKNYATFKKSVDLDYKDSLSDLHHKSLNFFSKVIAPGLRPYEALLVDLLMVNGETTLTEIYAEVIKRYQVEPNPEGIASALSILQDRFYYSQARTGFGNIIYCEERGSQIVATSQFKELLKSTSYRLELVDILNLGEWEFENFILPHRRADDFALHHKYSREDVCRLLGWPDNQAATLFGYKVDYERQECPIFVTYDKDLEAISSSIHYKDYFISPEEFAWETRNRVTLKSKEVVAIEDKACRKLLFIKKSNDEGHSFYYMGDLEHLMSGAGEKIDDKGRRLPVVAMRFKMEKRVPDNLYRYLTT
ncbi:MAG: DEAD/DEAH box helicase [Spirochaetales bacterium]|nr:DEAD/DEAH box helicase [Spirochaetales bacterium]